MPREHGAWGVLAQSYFAGAILSATLTWLLLPAAGLALIGFLIREPLIVLVRQQFVWHRRTPEFAPALRWFALETAGALLCLALLAPRVAWQALAGLAATAILLVITAVWLTVKNRQRSMALQIVSAAGLCLTALLATLAATGFIPSWAWILWALLTAHAVASIPVVRARLDRKIAASRGQTAPNGKGPYWIQAAQVAAAAGVALSIPSLALPLLFSAFANLWELQRLNQEAAFKESLRQVGRRLLTLSIVHTIVCIAVLWRTAHP